MIGERIYQLRTEKNMSQGDLADALNVSRQSVSKWENNSATPELGKLMELSRIFGVSLDELVYGKTVKESKEKGKLVCKDGTIALVISIASIAVGLLCFAFAFDMDAILCVIVFGSLGAAGLLIRNDRTMLIAAWGVFGAMKFLAAGIEGAGVFSLAVLIRNDFGGDFWLCEWQMMQIVMLWALAAATFLYIKKT